MGKNLVFLMSSSKTGSRSGKDSVAQYMMAHLINTCEFSLCEIDMFSSGIKWFCREILGLPEEYITGDKKNEPTDICIKGLGDNVTCRQIQQFVGSEIGRDYFGEDIWVKRTCRKINEFNKLVQSLGEAYNSFYFVSDWRFDNEYFYLKEQGNECILIDVEKPSNSIGITAHRSDNSLVNSLPFIDYRIINDGSLDDLRDQSENVIDDIMNKYAEYIPCCS